METKQPIEWSDFEKLDIRTGTIVDAIPFDRAEKPAYKVYIDFGDLGLLKTSAQITHLYSTDDLIGNQVLAVVNFLPKQIADFMSDCLMLGVYSEVGVVILTTERRVEDGLSVR